MQFSLILGMYVYNIVWYYNNHTYATISYGTYSSLLIAVVISFDTL